MTTALSAEKAKIWADVLFEIKREIGEHRFNLWLGHTELIGFDEKRVEIGVPNLFIQEWLEANFREVFHRHCAEKMGTQPEVAFTITGKLYQESRARSLKAEQAIMEAGARKGAGAASGINPEFKLQHFVQGPGNRLSLACVRQIVEGNSPGFFPLFVHSESGLGKTHLLQAAWWAIKEAGSDRCVEYVSAEAFTNQFIYSLRRGNLDAFRGKYRNVDALLIDDVHFFANKSSLQEEFLHTYDALTGRKKQIVLASDVHPKRLGRLKESLVNRFAAGMVVSIQRPDMETRVKILERKAARVGVVAPGDILQFLAGRYRASVRELNGALMTVIAYARLTRRKMTLALAREAISEVDQHMGQALDMHLIEAIVSERFGVTREELHSGRRTRKIALPRQVCMYLGRELTNLSCVQIAKHFSSKHHTTVVFSHRRVRDLCESDKKLAAEVDALREDIARRSRG